MMPSDKKRINLTVPDDVYQDLQEFKSENGISNDASACLQLVIRQLRAEKNSKLMLDAMRKFSPEDLELISAEGLKTLKGVVDAETK